MRCAGPRGPSGVIATPPPCFSQATVSRKAALPPLALAGSLFLAAEPRMAGKPSRSMAAAMKAPSAESEIMARGGCARFSGQHAGESAIRPCQKQTSTAPPPSQTASAAAAFSLRQRMVASVSRR